MKPTDIPERVYERLASLVEKRSEDDCWLYTGALNFHGYGILGWNIDGVRYRTRAHRIAWIRENGELDDELYIRHLCHNPACCNPKHLKPGTHLDNMNDNIEAGTTGQWGHSKVCEPQFWKRR